MITTLNYPRTKLKPAQQHQAKQRLHHPSKDLDSSKHWTSLGSTVRTVDKLSKGKSNFENVLSSQNCGFERVGLGFNPQNKQDKFSKSFSKLLGKQPIVNSKQPVVTCFYCMKRRYSVRFCKIRKCSVPRGFMKWIPKGCEVSNYKNKSNEPTFLRGPNLVAWTHFDVGILEKHEALSYLIKFLEEKDWDWNWIKGVYTSPSCFKSQKKHSWSQTNDSLKGLHKRIRPSLSLLLKLLMHD